MMMAAFPAGPWIGQPLTRLLDDIRHGLIDVIVVYKVDRLTRSLADFAKMVEIFDAQGVSFVAMTQQFNTTTSMGRLTLNVLLSFAQFEREVTGERIRDKFAASKRKGMWMGGVPPLGYDVSERRLIVNETEAVTVREIFERYLILGSVRLLRNDLERRGVVSKVRVSTHRQSSDGRTELFARRALRTLLSNPDLHHGEVRHGKQERHSGQHEAILERELWERAQQHLREHAAQHRKRPTKASPSPLAGKLFDENGAPLYAQGAMNDGRRYRYYVSRELGLEVRESRLELDGVCPRRNSSGPLSARREAYSMTSRRFSPNSRSRNWTVGGRSDIRDDFLRAADVCWPRRNPLRPWSK